MSMNMCIWRHKLCNAKTGVGPTFAWSNEAMAQWHNGTMRQWDNGTMGQWDNGTN